MKKMGLSKNFKQVMLERNISVKELAKKLEVTPQSLSNTLYRDNMTVEKAEKIADALGCDVNLIMRDTGKKF